MAQRGKKSRYLQTFVIKYGLSLDFYLHSRQKSRSLWSLTTQTIALCVSWRYHTERRSEEIISNLFEVALSPFVKSCRFTVELRRRRNHQRERKGASASRVSPRIMDCWAAAKIIVRLQVCVCVLFWVMFCICKCMLIWTYVCLCNARHIINTQLANYNCTTVCLRSTLNWAEEFKKGSPSNLPTIIIKRWPYYLELSNTISQHGFGIRSHQRRYKKWNPLRPHVNPRW